MNSVLRCAVLSMAHVHAPAYATVLQRLPSTDLVAIWDDDEERGQAAADGYGVAFESNVDTLLAHADVDAVIITAETARHRTLCAAACEAGKHVLCEKPLVTNLDDAEAMIEAADRAHVILATAFPMRHNPPAMAVKQHLDVGSLGQVLAVRATNHGTLPPGWFQDPTLAGGGAVMDHTVHVVDLLRWYLGDEPVTVYVEMSHDLNHVAVEDAAFLTITFRSGVVATLDPSWSRPPSFPTWGDVTMEVACERGTLQLDAFAQKLIYYPQDDAHVKWLEWGTDANGAMITEFARAVGENRRPGADGRDGARALAVALAAYASSQVHQPMRVASSHPGEP